MELSNNISTYIKSVFGNDYFEKYQAFFNEEYPLTLRFSVSHKEQPLLIDKLKNYGIKLDPVKTISNAYYVIEGKDLIGKTIEHAIGKYYIQSLSSMIPSLVLNPSPYDVVMDLCAAPGSKSTQLSDLMNKKGTLYVNEPNLNRVKALVHNIDKMNAVNTGVLKYKGELLSKHFEEYFTKILVDVPCSALGVIQKKNEVLKWWKTQRVERIAELQLKLLISAIKMAKVGADIVYSTCTLTLEENEFVINKILKNYPVKIVDFKLNLPHKNGFNEIKGIKLHPDLAKSKRILPWEIQSEGFYIAKLTKTDKTEPTKKTKIFGNNKLQLNRDNVKIKEHINAVEKYFGLQKNILGNYKYIFSGHNISFVASDWKANNNVLFERIGTKFGIIDKNNSVRLHSHAAQILGKYAKQNIFTLKTRQELQIYFNGGIIKRTAKEKGLKIVKYNNLILGTGIALEKTFKSSFPKSKRSASII